MKKLGCLGGILWICATLTMCATGGGGKKELSRFEKLPLTPEMEQRFAQSEKLYTARRLSEAEPSFQAYLQEFPYNALTPKAYFRLGEIAFANKKYPEAIGFYQKAREKGIHIDWGPYSIFKQALSHFQLEAYPSVFSTLDEIPITHGDKKVALRAGSLRVSAAKKVGDPLEQRKGELEVIDAYEGMTQVDRRIGDLNWILPEKEARESLVQWIAVENGTDRSEDPNTIVKLWERHQGKTSGGFLAWKLARLYNQKGDYNKAAEWAHRYQQSNPKGEFVAASQALLADLEKRGASATASDEGRPTVGVMLPLTGKYQVYGQSVLHGLECAAGVFQPCRGDLGINLVVRDTQGDPKMASQIVTEFAARDDIRAIVGPLPQVEVDEATRMAETAQIPMVSLSQRADVARLGSYIFRNFLIVSDQVATLVDYACGDKNLKKFAILYPKSPAGEEYKKAYVEELNRCGGQLTAEGSYSPEAKNLMDAVRELKFSSSEQVANQAVTFQALFFPDIYRRVPDLIAALHSAGVTGVTLLGGVGWDHPDVASGFAADLEGAAYVSAFYPNSSNAARDFATTFQAAYGVAPTLLEAYAYDTLRLLGQVLKDHPKASRIDLRDSLAKVKGVPGVTGEISFDEEGDARRRLAILVVEQGEVHLKP